MINNIKKAGMKCKKCGYELLVKDDIVFCQNCKTKIIPNTE